MIPFLDLQAVYDEIGAELEAALSRVASSACYIGGSEVTRFEEEFAA